MSFCSLSPVHVLPVEHSKQFYSTSVCGQEKSLVASLLLSKELNIINSLYETRFKYTNSLLHGIAPILIRASSHSPITLVKVYVELYVVLLRSEYIITRMWPITLTYV